MRTHRGEIKFDWDTLVLENPAPGALTIARIIIIIIIVFCLIALPNQNKVNPWRVKKAGSIQYGNRKGGTHEWVISQTLVHVDSMNEGRQRNGRRRQAEKNKTGKK